MSKARDRMFADPAVRGAIMAAQFAKECGLPLGNLWEPGIARSIAADLAINTQEDTEEAWRFQLGLVKAG